MSIWIPEDINKKINISSSLSGSPNQVLTDKDIQSDKNNESLDLINRDTETQNTFDRTSYYTLLGIIGSVSGLVYALKKRNVK